MKRRNFSGVAVYPARASSPTRGTLVGVWLEERISPQQHQEFKNLNKLLRPGAGCIGVRSGASGNTAVTFICRMRSPRDPRAVAIRLIKIVAEVTGARATLRRLPNYHSVSRALSF